MNTEHLYIEELRNDKAILMKGFETVFQTNDYDQLCHMQTAMEQISNLYPNEAEPKRIVEVLKLVKGFFRES